MSRFEDEIRAVINKHTMEGRSNTPDYILAEYIGECLHAFENATMRRDAWWGVHLRPGEKYFTTE